MFLFFYSNALCSITVAAYFMLGGGCRWFWKFMKLTEKYVFSLISGKWILSEGNFFFSERVLSLLVMSIMLVASHSTRKIIDKQIKYKIYGVIEERASERDSSMDTNFPLYSENWVFTGFRKLDTIVISSNKTLNRLNHSLDFFNIRKWVFISLCSREV